MKLLNVLGRVNHFNICLVGLFVSISVLSSTARAEGMYVSVDAGKSKNYCDSCSGYDNAYRFGGGYQFSPIIGVEANYGKFPTSHWSVSGGGVTLDGSTRNSIMQVDATATIPFANAFFVIGKLGIAKTKYIVGASTTKATYGVGVQYDLSKHFAVRAQYEEFTYSFSLISAGVVMKF
jgi:opacity protein-like surface antigen